MNPLIILAATAVMLLGLGSASARTWTSADGSRRFEGELRSYNAEKGLVTVVLGNGQELRFTLDKLSAADRDFLARRTPGNSTAEGFTASLEREGVLRILKDDKFVAHKLDPRPRYYLLYFSASW